VDADFYFHDLKIDIKLALINCFNNIYRPVTSKKEVSLKLLRSQSSLSWHSFLAQLKTRLPHLKLA